MRYYLKKAFDGDKYYVMYQNGDTDIPIAKIDKHCVVEIIEEGFINSKWLNMFVKRVKMIYEAVDRMQIIGLHKNAINDFMDCILNYSERTPCGGALFWVHQNHEFKQAIELFENEYECLVYHATHEHTAFGECLSLLYVSKHEEEWEDDKVDLKKDEDGVFCPICYVVNLTFPDCSEFGSVGMVEKCGGLKRVC